ncbi:gliding-associated putative ABC transporter substrate-binding component GldG [Sedimentisphaera cyanobacteriorum]|uniref:Gliding-associated putative ABC transporter substrate-binding component GldG n=1 Tax=Sedimentisphaera cyanobacteriorum TaxID=1940790 RepID=A0A1Q2HLN9_9BACT|nr:Gldg family protein [Sedimentisphaera cyanobacteriorum]AQQ08260.1 gliding-associated putative ABC transporter substrate-binding component GldG [Sedimentisphaera cyanobacteriorum]
MNRTLKAWLAVFFVLVIVFCANTFMQRTLRKIKADVTERQIYTLSEGTKNIIDKLNQPITLKLYYAEKAAMKGPDRIRFFNIYYDFVKSLLEEYESVSDGMIDLEVIDPRPYSEAETEAIEHGLKKFPITEEENFFFGLVVQTQFGVEKSIPFFSPDRQDFVEYDISYLIDTAITREKKKIGVISSLPVTGQDVSDYMARMMRMQGQQPEPSWTFINQLKEGNYEVENVGTDVNKVEDVDILMVIHPKDLPENTLFAIDQFAVTGGRTIICTDPHAFVDQPDREQQMSGQMPSQSSNLNELLAKWGVEMEEDKFAGDKSLAIDTNIGPSQRPAALIGYLGLKDECFNKDHPISSSLNDVRMLFPGSLKFSDKEGVNVEPLLSTTNRGNTWSVDNQFELMRPNPERLMQKFTPGDEPVDMACIITGELETNFPDGIDVEVETEEDGQDSPEAESQNSEDQDGKEEKTKTKHLNPSEQTSKECAVVVFSDVDFISDMVAYRDAFFGSKMEVADNASVLLNAIEHISGSSDLLSIRSRGTHKRPFTVVEQIEQKAEERTAEQEEKIKAEISGFEKELQEIIQNSKGDSEEVIGSSIMEKKKELELKIRKAKARLQDVKRERREEIEALGNKLRNINMLLAPGVILVIAVILWLMRATKRRNFVSNRRD